jgi:hypothetical protein
MRGYHIIAASLAAHAGLAAVVHWTLPAGRQGRYTQAPPELNIEISSVEPVVAPVEAAITNVVLLAPPADLTTAPIRSSNRRVSSAAIAAMPTSPRIMETIPTQVAGGNALSMRSAPALTNSAIAKTGRPNLHLGTDAPMPVAPLDIAPADPLSLNTGSISLRPTTNGGAKADLGKFVARIDESGKVSFRNKPNVTIKIALPRLRDIKAGAKAAIADWIADPYAMIRNENTTRAARSLYSPTSMESIDRGSDNKPTHGGTVPLISGGFDVGDALMNSDPYAAAKRDFIAQTAQARDALHAQHQKRSLANTKHEVLARLQSVRVQPVSAKAKRLLLFHIWDECLESGDDDQRAAADIARTTALEFARQYFAAGSTDAYSEQELVEMNAQRTSKAIFSPY